MPFLHLTTIGWKSGRKHEIEIWFVESNGKYYIVSEMNEKSHWVQNIKRDPSVEFKVNDSVYRGKARLVRDSEERKLAREVRNLMQGEYKWSTGLIVELTISPNNRHKD